MLIHEDKEEKIEREGLTRGGLGFEQWRTTWSGAAESGWLEHPMGHFVRYFKADISLNSLLLQQVDTQVLGLSASNAKKFPFIASMGIYMFKTDVLLKILR